MFIQVNLEFLIVNIHDRLKNIMNISSVKR